VNWLRWYHGTTNDPKWRTISKMTGQPVHVVLSIWAAILENASDSPDRGTLSNWCDEDVGIALDLDGETVKRIRNAMKQKSMFRQNGTTISSWEKRNPKREREDLSTERVQRFREKKRHATPRNATKRLDKSREENTYTPDFELFWQAYPKKRGKGYALKAWQKNGHPGIDRILEVLTRAKAHPDWIKQRGQFIPNPASWLNGKCWEDDYGKPAALKLEVAL
jgi:hypothetical protein